MTSSSRTAPPPAQLRPGASGTAHGPGQERLGARHAIPVVPTPAGALSPAEGAPDGDRLHRPARDGDVIRLRCGTEVRFAFSEPGPTPSIRRVHYYAMVAGRWGVFSELYFNQPVRRARYSPPHEVQAWRVRVELSDILAALDACRTRPNAPRFAAAADRLERLTQVIERGPTPGGNQARPTNHPSPATRPLHFL
ncbi:hypothetical protein ACFYZ8_33485 [Streptomyces sp. NPDC001668]|uniref:hypothetical protein n=1 Tax=Streptomyces sp. NPDC001668 TaxID=3364598 RepID=UPI0036A2F74E